MVAGFLWLSNPAILFTTVQIVPPNPEQVARKEAILRRIAEDLTLPEAPIEMIIARFGQETVAEMTGRSTRYIMIDGKMTPQPRNDHIREKEVADFMDDKRRILIFSGKGGTGSSYHASLKHRNQRVRSYLTYRDKLLDGSIYYDEEFCDKEDWDDYINQMMTVKTKPGLEQKEDLVSKTEMEKSPDMPDSTVQIFATQSPESLNTSNFVPEVTGQMETASYESF